MSICNGKYEATDLDFDLPFAKRRFWHLADVQVLCRSFTVFHKYGTHVFCQFESGGARCTYKRGDAELEDFKCLLYAATSQRPSHVIRPRAVIGSAC